jgi:ATP-dependent DNA ligase
MPLKPPIPPMEARSVDEIPTGEQWQYEPKWDGFRCLVFRDRDNIFLQSKNGQPLARYFPDAADNVAKLPHQQFVLDGELVIPIGGALSFDELQLRCTRRRVAFRSSQQLTQRFISFLIYSPRMGHRF